MAEISVIIPVHNTGKYLDRCLDSVLGQTLADIEVICVDDASDDGSAGILARRAEQDGRLKVLTQENNAGPGMARNRGIDCAGGRFIYFLDSDDWIESALLAEMLYWADQTQREVIINSRYVKEYDDVQRKEYSTRFGFLEDVPRAYETSTVQLLFPPVLWARLYSRKYLNENNIRFPSLRGGGEDNYFTTLAELPFVDLFIFHGPPYHYFQRDGSLAHLQSAGFDYLQSFKALYDQLCRRGLPTDGLRLFYAGPLVLDSREKFDFARFFLSDICSQVRQHPERYVALDLYLLDTVTSSTDYEDFLDHHNPNIVIDFVRHRMHPGKKT